MKGNPKEQNQVTPSVSRESNEQVTASDSPSISDLLGCHRLRSVTLCNYGHKCETDQIKTLLLNLRSLDYLYHRELVNAVMKIRDETRTSFCKCILNSTNSKNNSANGEGRKLSLKKFDLTRHFGVYPEQRIYVSEDYIDAILELCPEIEDLHIVSPSNIDAVLSCLKLRRLQLKQVSNKKLH